MDWYNPGKEADAAKALMDQGADILTQHTDSPAAIQAAEQRGIWCFGQSSDMSRFGPKHCATSIVENWSLYYPDRVQLVLDGKWTSTDTWDGLKSGMVELAPLNPGLPDDVRKEAEQVIADIKSGKRLPFAGPMKDQTGKITVADGQSLPDKDIHSIGYYVEGVQGALPK
jgi:simple sugar transport system substrate-binding protein